MDWKRSAQIAISEAFIFLAALYLIVYPKVLVQRMDSRFAALMLAALVPWLTPWLVVGFEVTKVKFLGIEFERIQGKLDQAEQKLALLTEKMEYDTYDTLKSLQEENSFTYPSADGWANEILKPQLRFLHRLGYISKSPEEFGTTEIGNGTIVTDKGREFIRKRKIYEADLHEKLRKIPEN